MAYNYKYSVTFTAHLHSLWCSVSDDPLCLLISWILHYLGTDRMSQVFAGLIPFSRAEKPRLLLEDARFCLCEQHWLLANKLVSLIRRTRIYLKREHEHKVWGAMLLWDTLSNICFLGFFVTMKTWNTHYDQDFNFFLNYANIHCKHT